MDKNNIDQLAQAIISLLKDDNRREVMGRAGRHRVLERFTWDRIAAGMEARYRELCQSVPVTSQVAFDLAVPVRSTPAIH